MAAIANIYAELSLNSAKFRQSLDKSTKYARSRIKEFEKFQTKAGVAAGKALSAGLVAGGVAAGIAAIKIRQASVEIDAIAKTADKIGIATDKLVGLQFAGEQTGVAINTTNMALQRMVRRVAEAAQGTGEAKNALKELGIDAKELSALTPDQMMGRLADSMTGVERQSDRVRLAMKLFDSEGVALVNTLALGSDGLAAMQSDAEALGITFSRFDAAKLEAANDSFNRGSKLSKAFGNHLTIGLAPALKAVTDNIVSATIASGGMGEVGASVSESIVDGLASIIDGVNEVQKAYRFFGDSTSGLFAGVFESFAESKSPFAALIKKISPDAQNFSKEIAISLRNVQAEHASEFQNLLVNGYDGDDFKAQIEKIKADTEQAIKDAQKRETSTSAELSPVEVAAIKKAKDEQDRIKKENDNIVSLQKEKFARIHEEALLAQDKHVELENLRYTNEKAGFERDLALLNERGLATEAIKAQFRTAEQEAESIHQAKLTEIAESEKKNRAAQLSAQLGNAQSFFQALSGLQKEGSKSQKRLFKISQGIALAKATVNMAAGISEGVKLGWPMSIPAVAYAALTGAQQISAIKQQNVAGIAHGGLTNVPEEATYLLQKNERVLSPKQNRDFTESLGKTGAVVNIYNQAGASVTSRQNSAGGQDIYIRAKDDAKAELTEDVLRGGSDFSDAFERSFGLQRVGT